ncbi:hypothetical protein [Pedobacter lusitanus]|uniref:hypothetical protein n=1 Tax=Pedobacter lusitanus TaxID=1503925 RepID=UPI0032AFBE08
MAKEKTFIGKILAAVFSVFKENYKDFLVKLWNKIPTEIKPQLIDIVQIIERIKSYVDSPAVDLITFAIPGDKDDKAVAWLRLKLNDLINELKLHDVKPGEYKKTDLQPLATRLTQEVTGMSYGQSAITIENAYQNTIKANV